MIYGFAGEAALYRLVTWDLGPVVTVVVHFWIALEFMARKVSVQPQ